MFFLKKTFPGPLLLFVNLYDLPAVGLSLFLDTHSDSYISLLYKEKNSHYILINVALHRLFGSKCVLFFPPSLVYKERFCLLRILRGSSHWPSGWSENDVWPLTPKAQIKLFKKTRAVCVWKNNWTPKVILFAPPHLITVQIRNLVLFLG